MLGGLYFIENEIYNLRGEPNTSGLLNDRRIVNAPSQKPTFPIKVNAKNLQPYHREAFEIIKDKFELVDPIPQETTEIISIYGEPVITNGLSDNPHLIFPYIRNLFLDATSFHDIMIPGKRIFITRKFSGNQHGGVLKRCIKNEEEFSEKFLKKHGFEYVVLENYPTLEKIRLFAESEIVLSTSGSQLTFSLFSNKKAKIIEIVKHGELITHGHNENITKTLGIPYSRYSDVSEDPNGNFTLDIDAFEKFFVNEYKNIML
jgi:capsular polysaccharide biosynthesis protein